MTIVSQKTDARNELAGAGFVRAPNVGIVKDATWRVLAPISVTPEAFTTDIADIQGQFPIVWNTERMPYASAVHNTQYYYDNTVVGGAITTTVTTLPIGKGVVSEEGGYVLLDISKDATPQVDNGLSIWADGRIELGWVLHQTTTIDTWAFDLQLLNLNVLSTPTTEALAIDTATGQIGRIAKDLYFSFQQDWDLDSFDNTTMWYRYSLFWHTFIRTTSTTHSAGTINLPSTANTWMLEFEYWTDIEYRTNLDFLKQATIIKFNWNTLPVYHNYLRESFKDLWTTQSWWSKPRAFVKDSFKVILTPWVYNITSEPLLVVQNTIANPPSNADLEANFWWVWYQIKATPF